LSLRAEIAPSWLPLSISSSTICNSLGGIASAVFFVSSINPELADVFRCVPRAGFFVLP
jgi:hypothetical protein